MDAADGNTAQERILTERLSVRRVRADDWRAIRDIWADEAASVYARYDRPNDTSDAAALRVARWGGFAHSDEHIFLAVCLEEIVIGFVALNRREKGYEMGYCFHSAYHRKGYARESIGAILGEMKKKGVRLITAGTALENAPSVALLQSLGFTLAGTERVSFYKDGQGRDVVFEGGIFELTL